MFSMKTMVSTTRRRRDDVGHRHKSAERIACKAGRDFTLICYPNGKAMSIAERYAHILVAA